MQPHNSGLPVNYIDVSHGWKIVFWTFAIVRIVVFFYFGIVNLVQFLLEMRAHDVNAQVARTGTRLPFYTRKIVYFSCGVMSITRAVAFILKLIKLHDNLTRNDTAIGIIYYTLIIIGTYFILMEWCAIGSFWISIFYLFFSNKQSVLNRKVSRRLNIILGVTIIMVTLWVIVMIIINAATKINIITIYNIIYLLVILYLGCLFTSHGITLSRAFKKEMEVNPGLSSSPTMILSAKKTDFLVKVLAALTVVAIARSFVFTFAVDEGFSMSQIGDFFAFIIEVGQMLAVMMAVSGGKFIPFFMFRRAYNTMSSDRVSTGLGPNIGAGLSSEAFLSQDSGENMENANNNNTKNSSYYQYNEGNIQDTSSINSLESNITTTTTTSSISIRDHQSPNLSSKSSHPQEIQVQQQPQQQQQSSSSSKVEINVKEEISVCPTNGGS